ncbi:unnamed protein product [Cylicocyclus nassatus]|uniref:Transposase n=1 Tax=Cylicocyclus nassatus TaxID=53992 RepID=A0AA36H829_CYLNA|nr:unnamed protein product [Cylicocyclus nassatus]
MSKNEVWNVYKRAKNPKEPLRRGRPRKLDPRFASTLLRITLDLKSNFGAVVDTAYNAIAVDEITNAAELRSQLELAHASVQTVQRRLRELMSTEHRALLKNLIVRLHDEDGWAFRRIAAHLEMSKSGVWGIYKSTRNPAEPAPLGRKRSTDERWFGLHGRRPATKPFISFKYVGRIQIARQHVDWQNQWRGVLWSNESKLNMAVSNGRQWVRRPVRERYKPKYTKSSVKCEGGNHESTSANS